MSVIKITDEHWGIINGWIETLGEKFSEMHMVPKEAIQDGYISYVGDVPVCATFVYDNGMIAWLAWTVANPDAQLGIRAEAFENLFNEIEKKMFEKGIRAIFAGTNNPSLIKRFHNSGFIITNYENVHMIKPLGV
jgi:hypothetical protein